MGELNCRICGCEVKAEAAVGCQKCGAAFHRDCWEFNGQCGIYGCGSTEFGELRLVEATSLVSIDENSSPPWRIEPYLESFIRRLPLWGRAYIPPVSLGAVGAATVYGLCIFAFGKSSSLYIACLLLASGCTMSFIAALLGERIRNAPVLFASFFGSLGALTFHLAQSGLRRGLLADLSAIVFIVSAAICATSIVELFSSPLKSLQEKGSFVMGVGRGLMTMFALFLYFLAMKVCFESYSSLELMDWPLAFSVFGLFVACPPLELSKSALMHRLKAEAKRLEESQE